MSQDAMKVEAQILDMLVIGAGPAGTAAAFRAQELGVSCYTIDYDDVIRRIRDYSKDKLILPDFGGGDRMQFPAGDDLISSLPFEAIDKDELCQLWKQLYVRFKVPIGLGIEFQGLEKDRDGIWQIHCWHHEPVRRSAFRARHVVLAFGRGVPRRLDIPGEVKLLALRLQDPERYLGKPVCIVGGGTSAAEAVISISKAKAASGDTTDVYWSYRGDKMPKVSKALADVLFESYMGNGNIRYLPHSEPVSILSGDDHSPRLCVRTDRKHLNGRPVETTLLEFAVSHCIGCIGEEIPKDLLALIGLELISGGPRNRTRVVVNPLLETVRPNLYLAGDILSPAYLQSEDFDGDPAQFSEITRRGNIKAALRDGVFLAEVIKQRLDGKSKITVQLGFQEVSSKKRPSEVPSPSPGSHIPVTPADEVYSPRLVRELGGGITAEQFSLDSDGASTIGRRDCTITFAEDSSLSDVHASIHVEGKEYFLNDESSRDGVYLQPQAGRGLELSEDSILQVGGQWLVFQSTEAFTHYDSRGEAVQKVELKAGQSRVLGRSDCDLVLDPHDAALSRRHLALKSQAGKVTMTDLRSTNGTLVKIKHPHGLHHGDRILLGNQVLRFQTRPDSSPTSDVDFKVGPAPSDGVKSAEPTAPSVSFLDGPTASIRLTQTICELAEECGISIKAQCHQGICGSDPIRILGGKENLNQPGETESETLEDLCALQPGESRLACMVRTTGPVKVEIIQD